MVAQVWTYELEHSMAHYSNPRDAINGDDPNPNQSPQVLDRFVQFYVHLFSYQRKRVSRSRSNSLNFFEMVAGSRTAPLVSLCL